MTLLFLLFGCQPHPVQSNSSSDASADRLVIAHTNDLHAHFQPNRADWLDGTPDIGGFASIAAHVERLHRERGDDNVLYLDGGDIMTGTPLMEFEVRGAKGGAMLDFMEGAGMDAWVLGNHEFDIGFEHVSALVTASRIPVLSANLDATDGSGVPAIPGVQDHTIFERAGLKVGVFGLTTDSLSRLTGTNATDRLDVRDVVESAAEQVALLEPKVDLVVALTHVGLEIDQKVAEQVAGIDLIVGGHSHTSLRHPLRVGDTWIVQAGSYARQLGVTEMNVVDGRIVDFEAKLVDLMPGDVQPSEEAASLMKLWSERIDALFAEEVGSVVGATLGRSKEAETPMGRWAADMVREAGSAHVGIYNPGGLRANLVPGPLTRGDLYQVFPFSNAVVLFQASGSELLGLLIKNAGSELSGRHPVMQMSGIRADWELKNGSPSMVRVTVDGEALDPASVYTVATNSYVADRWQYNLGFEPQGLKTVGMSVFEAAVARAKEGPISSSADPRMNRIDR
jgi:2',3'-cyclic-nucleotide 2'-phosphodiesterase (5'-nucleotidase family)